MKKIRDNSYKKILLLIVDVLVIALAGFAAYALMSFAGMRREFIKRVVLSIFLTDMLSVMFLAIAGAYRTVWKSFKKHSLGICVCCCATGCAVNYIMLFLIDKPLYKWFYFFMFVISSVGICVVRLLLSKTLFAPRSQIVKSAHGKRTLIVGAGRSTQTILKEMKNSGENSRYYPVCIVDDDVAKLGDKIYGVSIVGNIADIPALCSAEEIELIMFSIPSADVETRIRILDVCNSTGVETKIIPDISELLFDGNRGLLQQAKSIKIEDLLGRAPITFNNNVIASLIKDRTVMVTGGGGSIGSELCRQIAKYKPKHLIIVDIYENNAYDIQQELVMEYGDKLNATALISSVRDSSKMRLVFDKYKPEIVFHAAAHKHVPLMETVPEEAVKNNVMGTFNVASLAYEFNVDKFILISTDKAVNPTNVMGATKRCCEMIVQYFAQLNSDTDFVAVRFGNVLGSNGSVVPLFKRQIEAGGPITITHKDIVRYFMTIPEAVSLVIEAASMAHGGEIFVLDMGEPVKILSLAEKMIVLSGKVPYADIQIDFIGLRPGEKLYEEILMNEEGLIKTDNTKIFVGGKIAIDEEDFIQKISELRDAAETNDSDETVKALLKLVPTFRHEQRCLVNVR